MRSSFCAASLVLAACTPPPDQLPPPPQVVQAAPEPAPQAPRIAYPETRRMDLVETQFGTAVPDPYRWLENDVRTDPEVRAWVEAQNAVTNAFLATLPGRAPFKARMTELYDYERFGIPEKKGGRYFYTRNSGLQNQAVLYVRDRLDGEGRLLIDPNIWSADGATALADWVPSEDGTKLLYSIQEGGSDWRTVRVLDVATAKPLADEVKWVKFSGLEWAKDGSGFFYSRFPEPAAGAAFQSLNKNQEVYFHKLGTPQSADRRMFATPAKPDIGHYAEVSDDGRWLVVTSSTGTDERYEVTLVNLRRPAARPRVLIPGFEHNYTFIGNRGPTFYFVTNEGAPRQKIVSLDIARAGAKPTTVVAEDEATLTGGSLVGGALVAAYMKDAKSDVRVHGPNGTLRRVIDLPGIGTAGGFSGDYDDPETFFAFTSFNRPTTIYRYDVASGAASAWAAPKVQFNADDYSVEQRFYTSKDGTRVPMFVVMKKGLDRTGGSPTVLYGYGGFYSAVTPGFSSTRLAWLEAGGVYASANIRGGSEYGKAWHDAGRLANKQNVFDDFIAAGEYLKAQGIASPKGLAIDGGSNGGLLVGAVINQRPDLFDAARPAVGVMDMLRFDRFTAGRYWVDDYGYPDKEPDFRTLLAYSPYHNLRRGVSYPPVLATTADTDDRVVPGHSFKYIAALQAADPNGAPHLIRIETRAGHGSGKPTTKIIEEAADVYAFLAHFTGLRVGQR
ncbi:prolyl oligopeptidase family serine peptidase [Sphingomonas sp.]|uniref:prolyl oligopeptidase family serine peptidase n=1 Tax=Sphingomonas sp. TaxID=28214 RepID=UPI0018285022|nr:prolyl oligopeptidase family serine peptidase [Sphingomonas sp.]MBA3510751.1 S9 family peptidase [Sphingomonas sp.]